MLNHIVIMGRFVANPELHHTQSGVSCTTFTLAVERDVPDKDGQRVTDFLDCVAWHKTAEFVCRYFTKGKAAIVNGKLQVRPWKDKAGNNRRAIEIIADDVYFASTKN